MNLKFLLLPVFCLVLSFQAAAQSPSADTLALIDKLFEDWNYETPGAAIAIGRNGEMLYNKAFGMANLEHSVKNTPETIFEAGSVSKQFTAAALLLLVMDGKISLDADVRKHVPELPDYGEVIKIRHLLNHTSGLKDWGSIASITGWPRTTRVYTQDYARDFIFRQSGLNHSPGEEYIYSNSNYTLLVTIVERISGQTLPEFTEERIFKPLGMKSTRWRNNFKEIVPGRAEAYNKSNGKYFLNMPFENTYGHAALLTTVEDLVTWNESWIKEKLGGKELSAMRVEKGILLSGKEIPYAAAVMVNEINGLTEISHSGSTAGYRAWLASYPDKQLTVAYLSNDGSVSPVTMGKKVAEIFLGKEEKPEIPTDSLSLTTEVLKQKEGFFKNVNSYDLLELKFEDQKLVLGNVPLKAISEDTLVRGHTQYIFRGDQLLVTTSTDPLVYKRTEKWEPAETALPQFTGHYSSVEAAGNVEFEIREGKLTAILTPSESEKLTPSFPDAFYAGRNKLYEFVRDEKGEIKGINISVSRAEKVYFEKVE